jgi:Sulfatase
MPDRNAGVRITVVATVMLVMMAGGALLVSRIPKPPPANIVLVVLDTVRYDRTSLAAGANPNTTPFLAELAARGTSFSRARSPAEWTVPAHASLLSGLAPRRHGAHFDHRYLPDEVMTIAESPIRKGYLSAAFSSNVNVSRAFNFDQGFDFFYEAFAPAEIEADGSRGKALLSNLAQWLDANPMRPIFLFINLMEAHLPYEADARHLAEFGAPALDAAELGAPDFLDRVLAGERVVDAAFRGALIARYDAALRTVDDRLRELVQRLENEQVLGENSILVVTSDHGEHLGENGLVDHQGALSEALLRVPLVYVGRGIPRGLVVDSPVSIESVAAHVDSLLVGGMKFERYRAPDALLAERWPAHEVVARLARKRPAVDSRVFSLNETAIVDGAGAFKFVRRADGDERLYRLEGVANEVLLGPSEELATRDRLRALLSDRLARIEPIAERFEPEATSRDRGDESALAELAATGYGAPGSGRGGGSLHAQIHLERGNRAFGREDFAAARGEYEAAARLSARFPAPYFNLAVIAEKSGAPREQQRAAWERYVDVAVRAGGLEAEKLAQAYARLEALK